MSSFRKEFFDREYTAREAYGRLWGYARRYRLRIIVGIVCGVLTAGTLLPLYQTIQPALDEVSENERPAQQTQAEKAAGTAVPDNGRNVAEEPPEQAVPALPASMAKAAKMPGWFKQAEKWAARLGLDVHADDGGISPALLLMIVLVVPLVALARLVLVFLNQYCLTWSGSHVVADLRVDMLKHVQRQSLEFFGKIDVGQLMSRATSDPAQVQMIIQQVLTELARAPFEIAVSIGYVAWFAVANDMLPTLLIIVVGFPMFLLPVVVLRVYLELPAEEYCFSVLAVSQLDTSQLLRNLRQHSVNLSIQTCPFFLISLNQIHRRQNLFLFMGRTALIQIVSQLF